MEIGIENLAREDLLTEHTLLVCLFVWVLYVCLFVYLFGFWAHRRRSHFAVITFEARCGAACM